jgi:hypothetical protein
MFQTKMKARSYANFHSWVNTLATSLISITAVSLIFVTTSTTILTSVPVNVKSLCGGMVSPTRFSGMLDKSDKISTSLTLHSKLGLVLRWPFLLQQPKMWISRKDMDYPSSMLLVSFAPLELRGWG